MKNDYLLSIVHRLKTSATSAKWSLKMLLSGDFGKISKEQKGVMERLYKKNDVLISLMENLLNAAKIEYGEYSYNKILADIKSIVESSIADFQDEIKSKKIKFEFKKTGSNFPKVIIDKEKIESVIENLLDNALKYTAKGGKIIVSLEADEKNIKFTITDSGIGIPAAQQAKVFDKFFRAENTGGAEADGSGVGLFIAKKIIEGHNGAIGFESEENKGSAFYFTLPIEVVK